MKWIRWGMLPIGLLISTLGAQTLTLDEAVARALTESKGGRIMAAKTRAAQASQSLAEKQRLPNVKLFGLANYDVEQTDVTISEGSLSTVLDYTAVSLGMDPLTPEIGPFPSSDLTVAEGDRLRSVVGLSVQQPLTQQWRIGSGIEVAQADAELAEIEYLGTQLQLQEAVEKCFAGVRLEEARRRAAQVRVAALEAQLQDARNAQAAGEALDARVLGAQAQLTEARTLELQSRQRREALLWQLADLIGWEGNVEGMELATEALPVRAERPLADWLARVERNPDFRASDATTRKAAAGVSAAKQEAIPDLVAYATVSHQEGLPLLPSDYASVGVALSWDVFDFGRRSARRQRSEAQQEQAELDRDRTRQTFTRAVRTAYQAWEHANESLTLAREAETFRARQYDLETQAVAAGEALPTAARLAEAEWRQAQANRLGAELQAHLALLRLHALSGDL